MEPQYTNKTHFSNAKMTATQMKSLLRLHLMEGNTITSDSTQINKYQSAQTKMKRLATVRKMNKQQTNTHEKMWKSIMPR